MPDRPTGEPPAPSPRQRLVEAGARRLSTRGLDGLRMLLTASSLAADAGVARDSAYRVFRTAGGMTVNDEIVLAVGALVNSLQWRGGAEGITALAERYVEGVARGEPPAENLRATLEASIRQQQRLGSNPASWLIHAALWPAGASWQGEPIDGDLTSLANALAAQRREMYATTTDQLEPLMAQALSDAGRRPRRGIEMRQIIEVMHCLIDGAALRSLVDPDAAEPSFVADAAYVLAYGLTEDGALADPRRPADQAGAERFDLLVRAAISQWRAGDPEVGTTSASREAGVEPAIADRLFPTTADLADSALWAVVLAVADQAWPGATRATARRRHGDDSLRERQVAYLSALGLLRRLSQARDELPAPFAVVAEQQPFLGPTMLAAALEQLTDALTWANAPKAAPARARRLLERALGGTANWATLTELLDTMMEDDGTA